MEFINFCQKEKKELGKDVIEKMFYDTDLKSQEAVNDGLIYYNTQHCDKRELKADSGFLC